MNESSCTPGSEPCGGPVVGGPYAGGIQKQQLSFNKSIQVLLIQVVLHRVRLLKKCCSCKNLNCTGMKNSCILTFWPELAQKQVLISLSMFSEFGCIQRSLIIWQNVYNAEIVLLTFAQMVFMFLY